jgi:beta-phosphoglucomutase
MMLKAIIFDFDGVLGNTEHIQKRKWDIVLEPYHITISDEVYGRLYSGKSSTSEIPGLLKQHYPHIPCSAAELAEAAAEELRRLFPISRIDLMPGALDILAFVRKESLKTAICSGKSPAELALKLDKAGLAEWFPEDLRVTQADAGNKGKPDPGMYHIALKKLGVAAAEAVIFEDTASGVLAARAAGVKVVALPNFYSREHDFGKADLVMPGGWDEVLGSWESVRGLVQDETTAVSGPGTGETP